MAQVSKLAAPDDLSGGATIAQYLPDRVPAVRETVGAPGPAVTQQVSTPTVTHPRRLWAAGDGDGRVSAAGSDSETATRRAASGTE